MLFILIQQNNELVLGRHDETRTHLGKRSQKERKIQMKYGELLKTSF